MNIEYTESIKALEYLENLDLDSDSAEKEINNLLKSKIIVPFIHAIIPQGLEIYRTRKNENGEEFTNKEQISYNPHIEKISRGRANRRGQSIFYASHKWETSLFETSSITKYGIDGGKEIFTIGRWHVKKPFLLVVLIPRLDILDKNEESFKRYIEIISNTTLFQTLGAKKHLKFFSDQFVRKTNGNENFYKISSEYFNHCLDNSPDKIYGMLYPSVEYDYGDLNLALIPEAVNKFLILDMVVKYEITIKGKNGIILPLGLGDIKKYEF